LYEAKQALSQNQELTVGSIVHGIQISPEQLNAYRSFQWDGKEVNDVVDNFRTDDYMSYTAGTDEVILEAQKPKNWNDRAVYHLQTVTKYSTDISITTEAYTVIGFIYQSLGSSLTAKDYYQKALVLMPENAGTRQRIIRCFDQNKLCYQSYLHLDTLFEKQNLIVDELPRFARYSVLANQSEKTIEALALRQKQFPFKDSLAEDVSALYSFLKEKPNQAISKYLSLLKQNPSSINYGYGLAQLYMKNNQAKEAYQRLDQAIKNGFNGFWVLKYDMVWDKERNKAAFKNLVKDVKPKKFKEEW
jgi:tetratricopeptide (TPR) repeat protein